MILSEDFKAKSFVLKMFFGYGIFIANLSNSVMMFPCNVKLFLAKRLSH